MIELLHIDCMEYMRGCEDKVFDLAIVDPPYGEDNGNKKFGMWRTSQMVKKDWDKKPLSNIYFNELFRVSKNQIIWGGNYFTLPISRSFIVWDKGEGFKDRDFAECEQAYTSFNKNAKIFKRDPLAKGDYKFKIHPTQKPIALYKWLLKNYAKPGDKILDTHGGSMSIAIACHQMGFDLTLCEIDKDYYEAGLKRVANAMKQQTLFNYE